MACQTVCKQGRDDISDGEIYKAPFLYLSHTEVQLLNCSVKRCRDKVLYIYISSLSCTSDTDSHYSVVHACLCSHYSMSTTSGCMVHAHSWSFILHTGTCVWHPAALLPPKASPGEQAHRLLQTPQDCTQLKLHVCHSLLFAI